MSNLNFSNLPKSKYLQRGRYRRGGGGGGATLYVITRTLSSHNLALALGKPLHFDKALPFAGADYRVRVCVCVLNCVFSINDDYL